MSDSLWEFLLLSSAQDINSITLECCRPLWKLASVFFILFYLMFRQKRGQWINELYRFMSYRDHIIAILTNWAKDYALSLFPTCENNFVYFYYWKYTSKLCWFRDLIAWWFVTYVNGTLFLCLYWLITSFKCYLFNRAQPDGAKMIWAGQWADRWSGWVWNAHW